jgi:hypothetical protein
MESMSESGCKGRVTHQFLHFLTCRGDNVLYVHEGFIKKLLF